MRIDFRAPGKWLAINESLTDAIAATSKISCSESRIYQGIKHAMIEAVIGASQLYPLKKKVFYFKNMNPFFEAAVMPLAKLGYQVTQLGLDVLTAPEEWAKTLERDVLLILYSVDEPLLGRTYDVKALEAAFVERSILQVRVSHERHLYDGPVTMVPRSAMHLYSLSEDQALACVGDRARIGAVTADQLSYHEVKQEQLDWVSKSLVNSRQKIEKFEGDLPSGINALWPKAENRLYDRALLFCEDLDGYALIDRLAQLLKIELRPPGAETRLETTSLSRWQGTRTMNFYADWQLEPNVIRGLVMISADLINADTLRLLSEARALVLKDQSGDL